MPATKYSFGDSNNKSKSEIQAYAVRLKYATSLKVLSGLYTAATGAEGAHVAITAVSYTHL